MKLSALTIIILGACLAIVIFSGVLITVAMPNWAEAKNIAGSVEAFQAEANKMPQAVKRRQSAIDQVNAAAASWQMFVATRTPSDNVNTGGISLAVNAWQLSVHTKTFRNNVQRAVNAQVKKGGVKVITGPYVPGPSDAQAAGGLLASYYNFGPIAFPVVIYDLGTVTVQGTYKEICANVRAWANMPKYLAVASGLRIDGTSPQLTGTYQVSVVGFIKGSDIFPNVPEGAGGAAGSAGGFPGGGFPGGGFPGGGFPGGGRVPGGLPGGGPSFSTGGRG